MKKEDLIKEFKWILRKFKEEDLGYPYLCNLSEFHAVNVEGVLEYLHANEPTATLHPEFFNHESFKGEYCWWNGWHGGNVQRELFLNHLINQLEDEK